MISKISSEKYITCKCRFLSDDNDYYDNGPHSEIICPLICRICSNSTFSFHPITENIDSDWYECNNCHNYTISIFEDYSVKHSFYYDHLNLVVVQESGYNYIWMGPELEGDCIKLPAFEFNEQNIEEKIKIYTLFQ